MQVIISGELPGGRSVSLEGPKGNQSVSVKKRPHTRTVRNIPACWDAGDVQGGRSGLCFEELAICFILDPLIYYFYYYLFLSKWTIYYLVLFLISHYQFGRQNEHGSLPNPRPCLHFHRPKAQP